MTSQLALTTETGGMRVGYLQQATAKYEQDPDQLKCTTFHTRLIGCRYRSFTQRTKFRHLIETQQSGENQSINRATAVQGR